MFKNLYCGLVCIGDCFQSVLLLAIRLYWGYGFFQSGLGKLSDIGKVVEFFTQLGIPYPELNAYLAGCAECLGGFLLIVGLFSRIAALPLIFVMLVAYFTAHHEALISIWSHPGLFVAEGAFNFLLAALIVFAFGPGKLSLDYLICKLCFQRKCSADGKDDGSCHKS